MNTYTRVQATTYKRNADTHRITHKIKCKNIHEDTRWYKQNDTQLSIQKNIMTRNYTQCLTYTNNDSHKVTCKHRHAQTHIHTHTHYKSHTTIYNDIENNTHYDTHAQLNTQWHRRTYTRNHNNIIWKEGGNFFNIRFIFTHSDILVLVQTLASLSRKKNRQKIFYVGVSVYQYVPVLVSVFVIQFHSLNDLFLNFLLLLIVCVI